MGDNEDVQALLTLVGACPSFGEEWAAYLATTYEPDEPPAEPYIDVSELARHLVWLLTQQRREEVRAVFAEAERLVSTGSPAVQNFVTVGFIEAVQLAASQARARNEGVSEADFEPYLGPWSRAASDNLDDWWRGRPT